MDMRYFSIGVVLLAVFSISGWYLFSTPDVEVYDDPAQNISDAQVINKPLKEVPLFVDEKREEINTKEKYRLNIIYPRIVLATDPTTAVQLSDVIRGTINRRIEQFLENHRDVPKDTGIPEEFESELTIRYEAVLHTRSLVAIRFETAEYIRGSAHPLSQSSVVIYDLVDHALYDTGDLFGAGIDYLDYLSQTSRTKLRSEYPDLAANEFKEMVDAGTTATSENFSVVYPSADGLHVVFNPYQVAPYARGAVELTIPLAETRKVLSERTTSAIEEAAKEGPESNATSSSTPLTN